MSRLPMIGALLFILAGDDATAAPPKAPYATNHAFREVIEKKHREFDRCGREELGRTRRRVKGTVLLRFVVDGAGKVVETAPVHNTTKSRPLADCLARALERVTFPNASRAPVTAAYPFRFNLKK